MTGMTQLFRNPRANLIMAAVSAIAEVVSWFTTLDDPYRVTPVAFILVVLFGGLFALNEHMTAEKLRADAKPTLSLVLGRGPLFDSLHHDGKLRILRVGVMNTGATVQNVAVKLVRVEPPIPHVFPMQEFQQTHEQPKVSRFTVNKSDEPLVFVDVIHQVVHVSDGAYQGVGVDGVPFVIGYRTGNTKRMQFGFAGGARDIFYKPHVNTDFDMYLLWLAIDGQGADKAKKYVLTRNKSGSYDMTEAFS